MSFSQACFGLWLCFWAKWWFEKSALFVSPARCVFNYSEASLFYQLLGWGVRRGLSPYEGYASFPVESKASRGSLCLTNASIRFLATVRSFLLGWRKENLFYTQRMRNQWPWDGLVWNKIQGSSLRTWRASDWQMIARGWPLQEGLAALKMCEVESWAILEAKNK